MTSYRWVGVIGVAVIAGIAAWPYYSFLDLLRGSGVYSTNAELYTGVARAACCRCWYSYPYF